MTSIASNNPSEIQNLYSADSIDTKKPSSSERMDNHAKQFEDCASKTPSQKESGQFQNPVDVRNVRNEGINPGQINGEGTSFDIISDDASGTLFSITNENGEEIKAEVNGDNKLVIDGKEYAEVDDDTLSFSIKDGQLSVLHDGKALEGYTPIDVGSNPGLTMGLQDMEANAQNARFTLNGETVESSNSGGTESGSSGGTESGSSGGTESGSSGGTESGSSGGTESGNSEEQEKIDEYGEGQNKIPTQPGTENIPEYSPETGSNFEGQMTFKDYLSTSMSEDAFGLEQQKFQYGKYDSSDVSTLTDWNDVLDTGTVRENADGSVTLSSSAETPRVQFYPDDNAPGGRAPTQVSDLQDVEFGFSIDGWEEGDAAWIYELHEIGDGQAMAIGFNQEGNLMLANGNTTETDISLVDAAGISINYENGAANVSVLNQDGSVRGSDSIEISGDEVHVKGIELYNRRTAADTEVSATFNQISFGNNKV